MHFGVANKTTIDDTNEIDLDDEDGGNIKQDDSLEEREQDGGRDPDEIDLDETDGEQDEIAALKNDVAGDANCSPSPAPVSVAKKARTNDA